jgi:hypothetical protein
VSGLTTSAPHLEASGPQSFTSSRFHPSPQKAPVNCSELVNYGSIDNATSFDYLNSIRLLYHPRMGSGMVAGILYALADPVRVAIVRELLREEKGMNCSATIARIGIDLPKSTCSQHFRILRESELMGCL